MRKVEAVNGIGGANSPILGRQLLLSRLSDAVQAGTKVPAILSRASLYLSTTVGINLFPCAVCRSLGQLSLETPGLWIAHTSTISLYSSGKFSQEPNPLTSNR